MASSKHLRVLQDQGIRRYRPRRKTGSSKLLKIAPQIVRFLPVLCTKNKWFASEIADSETVKQAMACDGQVT